MKNIDAIRKKIMKKNSLGNAKSLNSSKRRKYFIGLLSRTMVCVLFFLVALISVKTSVEGKSFIYKNLYEKNFFFSDINKLYTKYLGNLNPFKKIDEEDVKAVFNEKLMYADSSKYLDGVSLTVAKNYLVPVLKTGIVTFIGEKEGYGNTIILQCDNGLSIWYSNIQNESVKMYDYIDKGKYLGEAKDTKLYLVFKVDGEVVNYKDYLK